MERMLLKMARQLGAYDEASLTSLWAKYAAIVERFEPSKRWEEAAIVFSLIQAVRFKNQLFNQHLAASLDAAQDRTLPGLDKAVAWMAQKSQKNGAGDEDAAGEAMTLPAASGTSGNGERRKVLAFRRDSGEQEGDKPAK